MRKLYEQIIGIKLTRKICAFANAFTFSLIFFNIIISQFEYPLLTPTRLSTMGWYVISHYPIVLIPLLLGFAVLSLIFLYVYYKVDEYHRK